MEITPLHRGKKTAELVIYVIFIAFSYIISLLLVLGVKIPSPAVPIKNAVMSLVGGGGN